jgi:hypothetical protein
MQSTRAGGRKLSVSEDIVVVVVEGEVFGVESKAEDVQIERGGVVSPILGLALARPGGELINSFISDSLTDVKEIVRESLSSSTEGTVSVK